MSTCRKYCVVAKRKQCKCQVHCIDYNHATTPRAASLRTAKVIIAFSSWSLKATPQLAHKSLCFRSQGLFFAEQQQGRLKWSYSEPPDIPPPEEGVQARPTLLLPALTQPQTCREDTQRASPIGTPC